MPEIEQLSQKIKKRAHGKKNEIPIKIYLKVTLESRKELLMEPKTYYVFHTKYTNYY